MQKLTHYGYPYALLVNDLDEALRLHDLGFQSRSGRKRSSGDLQAGAGGTGRTGCRDGNDLANTNVAFTVREMSQSVPIVTTANSEDSVDILRLAEVRM